MVQSCHDNALLGFNRPLCLKFYKQKSPDSLMGTRAFQIKNYPKKIFE
jgi:hypothetical protein